MQYLGHAARQWAAAPGLSVLFDSAGFFLSKYCERGSDGRAVNLLEITPGYRKMLAPSQDLVRTKLQEPVSAFR